MKHYKVQLDDVLTAHSEALQYGGRPGVLSFDGIESAIARPYSGYHRRIYRKAASLLHSLVQNHGFVDGNKRTALLVTLLMIERSGYRLVLMEDEMLDDIVVGVAAGDIDFVDLCDWFAARLKKNGETD